MAALDGRDASGRRRMAGWLLIPAAYQLLVLAGWLRWRLHRPPPCPAIWPPVSIFKPTPAGEEPPEEALTSHWSQDYPEFELLYDDLPGDETPNPKVGKLMRLAGRARHHVWIFNDADIRVPPGYLRQVVSALAQPGVGLVTTLYRARGDTLASRFEALGVAVDFMPSVQVARLLGVREFGLGATLAFRRADLERAGGLSAIAPYLADDYQLSARLARLGLRVELAPVWVETRLQGGWRDVWRHQIRWARTIRASKRWGYAGLPVTHAGVWALAAIVAGAGDWALLLLAVRWAAAATASRWFVLAPLWDLFAFVVWAAGFVGSAVQWGGRLLTLDSEGRIRRADPVPHPRKESHSQS